MRTTRRATATLAITVGLFLASAATASAEHYMPVSPTSTNDSVTNGEHYMPTSPMCAAVSHHSDVKSATPEICEPM